MNLEAVYPNPDDPNEEMSFEELRAKARGWADKSWAIEKDHDDFEDPQLQKQDQNVVSIASSKSAEYVLVPGGEQSPDLNKVSGVHIEVVDEESRSQKNERPKKMKIREVKAEAQTSISTCHVSRYVLTRL